MECESGKLVTVRVGKHIPMGLGAQTENGEQGIVRLREVSWDLARSINWRASYPIGWRGGPAFCHPKRTSSQSLV